MEEISSTNCTTGDVRLVDGLSPTSGKAEICINRVWTLVSLNRNYYYYTREDRVGQVVCRQLGYTGIGMIMFMIMIMIISYITILIARILSRVSDTDNTNVRFSCRGDESSLINCSRIITSYGYYIVTECTEKGMQHNQF